MKALSVSLVVISSFVFSTCSAQIYSEDFNDGVANGCILDPLLPNVMGIAQISPNDLAMASLYVDEFGMPLLSYFEDWLITPQISITGPSELSLDVLLGIGQFPDPGSQRVEILVSTTNLSYSSFTSIYNYTYPNPSPVVNPTQVDLSAYAGNDIYIAISNRGQNTYGMVWDNILVTESNVTSIDEAEPLTFSVYPNPANEVVNVKVTQPNSTVLLYDINGKLVYEASTSNSITINTDNMQRGLYLMVVQSDKKSGTKKLILN